MQKAIESSVDMPAVREQPETFFGCTLRQEAFVFGRATRESCLRAMIAGGIQAAIVVEEGTHKPLGVVDGLALFALSARDSAMFSARHFMKPHAPYAAAPANAAEAARILAQRELGFLLLLNADGSARGVLTREDLLASDTERLRRTLQAMERVTDELRSENEESGRENLRVMGMLAHDLRGPLGGIRSIAQLLGNDTGVPPAQVQHFAHLIETQSNGLLKLVRNILELARSSTGRVHLKLEPVDPSHLLYEASALYQQMASGKGVRFEMQIPAQPYPMVHIDREKMQNAIGNLLDNGVKYCSEGQTVRVWIEAAPTAVTIAVSDNGQGLAPQEQATLFERFKRASSVPTGGEPSTGLGLAIAKEIVQAHGGQILVEGDKGKGLTFRVVLPVHKGPDDR